MLRVLLCDDDELFLNRVKSRVEAFLSSQEEKFEILAHTDTSLITDRELALCDLALLDVDLATPEDDGIALARRLRAFRQDAVLIFVTNYVEFAPVGYEVGAFRYILKQRLDDYLTPYLALALKRVSESSELYSAQTEGGEIQIPLKNIERFEVFQHNVDIYLRPDPPGTEAQKYRVRGPLSKIEAELAERGFLRIHDSFLVNVRFITNLTRQGAELDNGTVLRVSKKMYTEIKQKYLLLRRRKWN